MSLYQSSGRTTLGGPRTRPSCKRAEDFMQLGVKTHTETEHVLAVKGIHSHTPYFPPTRRKLEVQIYIYVFEYDSLGKCDYVRHAESTRKAEAVFGRDAAGGGEHHSGGSESSAGIHTEAPGEGVRPRAVPLAHCLLLGVALV